MSTTTDEPIALSPPVETAPSFVVSESATASRVVGTAGLFFLVLGVFAIGAHRVFTTPRMISEGYGFIAAALGLALMTYHAARDNEPEMRRLYGFFGFAILLLAVGAGLVPGPVFAKTDLSIVGYNLPWSIAFGFVSLVFLSIFARNETEESYRRLATMTLLAVGALATFGAAVAGAYFPDYLAGPGAALAVLGIAYLGAYFGSVDTSEGFGFQVAVVLGLFGLVLVYAALARTIFPAVLAEGPQALRKPNGAIDSWKVVARLVGAAAFLVPAAVAYFRQAPRTVTGLLAFLGVASVGVLAVGSVSADPSMAKDPFLVPRGAALFLLGLICIAISLGTCSDNQFVTLTRRELGAYFTSPIGYLVLIGMVVLQWFQYRVFLEQIGFGRTALGGERSIEEPIVAAYFLNWLPVIAVLLLVPVLSMRLIAEERRSGSLEVLLTAPVGEVSVVLSKFLATLCFYMLSWLPVGLFLITLRLVNGEGFDYRPLLSFYLAMAACGAAFVAMGLFFSTISPNQLAAAVLTFVGMAAYFLFFFQKDQAFGMGEEVKILMHRLSFVDLWIESLKGQLPLRDVIAWLSLAGLWLFASVKVLEARRWK